MPSIQLTRKKIIKHSTSSLNTGTLNTKYSNHQCNAKNIHTMAMYGINREKEIGLRRLRNLDFKMSYLDK
jgi:hypothetical protein